MKTMLKVTLYSAILLTGLGCSSGVKTKTNLSSVYLGKSDSANSYRSGAAISLFALKNYTDTPRAGMRASNIIEGVMLAKGYKIITHIQEDEKTFEEMRNIALKENAKYFLYGGVSEWRYKTGIDGEPAVSLKCVLYNTKTSEVAWSATASDSDWINTSIGTTAQNLIESMIPGLTFIPGLDIF